MKRSVMLLSVLLSLVPLEGVWAKPVLVRVAYLGQGNFKYEKKTYTYNELVTVIQSDFAGQHIDRLIVEMGKVASQMDKAKVCQLRQSLLTPLVMKLTTDTGKQNMFCN